MYSQKAKSPWILGQTIGEMGELPNRASSITEMEGAVKGFLEQQVRKAFGSDAGAGLGAGGEDRRLGYQMR